MTPTIINEPFESTVTFAETAHKQVHTHTHTHTYIYLSHLFTGDLGNDGRLNVADGTSHSIQILFLSLSRSFKKSVQGQASSVNRAGLWFQIRRQNEGAHYFFPDVRKPERNTRVFFFSIFLGRIDPWWCCRVAWEGARGGFQASFEFPAWWISKGRSIKRLSVMTGVLMKAPNDDHREGGGEQ